MNSVVSAHEGMGATIYDTGACFRVWAPHAKSVHIAGTFNNFCPDSLPLFPEGNGFWAADIDGVQIKAQYQFVIQTADGQLIWRNDPYARSIVSGETGQKSVIAEYKHDWSSDHSYNTPAWNEMVIYELHIGTFDFQKDPTGHLRGTFDTVINRLDYLQSLGINTIEIMAAGEFPYDTSWGYNPIFIFAIEDSYGGPNGFRRLTDACHQRGMAVIFDIVYNHLGPADLELWRFDGWSENEGGGIYFYGDNRSNTPWGDTRPNFGCEEVRQYLRDNALRWTISRYVDGLRWDATNYIRNIEGGADQSKDIPEGWSLMQWINDEIKQRQPWKISIAEDMQNNSWLTKDAASGGAGFDSQWDSNFLNTIRQSVVTLNDSDRDMFAVATAIGSRFNGNAFERIIFTESHDANANGHARVPEEIWPGNADSYFSQKRSTLAAGIVFTAPGIPMIFQGQEFLESGWFDDSRGLKWSHSEKFAKTANLYRDLIRLRRNWYATTQGLKGQNVNVFHINNKDKVIAFHRWEQGGQGDDVVVVANFANTSYESYKIGFPGDGLWKVRLNSDWEGYGDVFSNHHSYDTVATKAEQDGMEFSGNIGLGPYSIVILSQ